MDSTDKHIKDLYNDVDGAVPDHLSWDKMQSGIYDRMPGRKRRISPVLWTILGISIGLALSGLFYLGGSTTPELAANYSTSPPAVSSVNTTQNKQSNASFTSALTASPSVSARTKNRPALNISPSEARSTTSTTATKAPSSAASSIKTATAYNTSETLSERVSTSAMPSRTAQSTSESLATTTYDKTEKVQRLVPKSTSTGTTALLSRGLEAPVTQSPRLLVADLPNYERWITPNKAANTLWRISAVTGSNYSSDRYSNYSSMQSTTSGLWGQQAGIVAARPIGKGPLYLEVGILVGQYNQRVQHEGIDKIMIDTSMMITSVNSLTGQTIAQRSVDTTMQVSRSRGLNYTNTAQRLHLRASLGYTVSLTRKWQAHLGLGMQVSRTISQSGYYIDDAREYRFAGQQRPLYTRWSSEIIPSLAVEYNMTKRYALYLGVNSGVGITNATAIEDAHLRLRSVGLNAGVTMRL